MTEKTPSRRANRRRRPPWIAAAAAATTLAAAATLVLDPFGDRTGQELQSGSQPLVTAADISPDGEYVLVNQHSGLAADVTGGSLDSGAEIIQWERTDRPWQRFRFVPGGDGFFSLVNVHSGMAVDVWERSTEDGAQIRQYEPNGGHHQQWEPVDSAGGVSLVNRHSGKALEVWDWSEEPGGRLSQFDHHGGAGQVWSVVRVDEGNEAADCGAGDAHAEAVLNGSTWTSRAGGGVLYEGGDMLQAMRAAVDGLTPGRVSQERVVVRGTGTVPADASLDLPSHTSLEVCGTIDVTGEPGAGHAPVRIRHAENVSVPHLTLTGHPYFGVYVRTSENVHLGQLDLRLSGGLGVRIDSRDDDSVRQARDIRVDDVFVSGTGSHGVETYGVDGLTIGTVTARDTGYSGLLLNDTVNADVGLVDAEGAGTGTGYAAFRMANRNGRVGDGYPANIRVGEVRARGGGRGIFCVSESGGAVIERVDIAGTGNNAVLVENCYNVTLAEQGGTVAGPGGIRIAARSEFPNSRDITFANLTLVDTELREDPCGENTVVRDITWQNSRDNTC
ncbi:RICIN domain-containing protein [Nocardiopsis terrae]